MEEQVILVDENDRAYGVAEKMLAHREAKLHRAFSIFVTNSQGELLLQKRSKSKYHSGGLWTNTCCSHPRPGEETLENYYFRNDRNLSIIRVDCGQIPVAVIHAQAKKLSLRQIGGSKRKWDLNASYVRFLVLSIRSN